MRRERKGTAKSLLEEFWAPYDKKDIEVLEHVQRRTMDPEVDLEHKSNEEWLRELVRLSLEKRRLKRDFLAPYSSLKGGWREEGSVSSPR
ncbi:hypothetical protein WISP_10943 [Willisornis vidua]|uniref:Uncharacterized protein n=1 Tax=Willisornis vidua TaxID=1566151 RepID=A0ABQ9DRG0_9PASS|nr:hypothetical protein WISP_10943 [Willisornis vidua]